MTQATRTHRNAIELAAKRVEVDQLREASVRRHDEYGVGHALGVLDALDWLDGQTSHGPASGVERVPAAEWAGLELLAAESAQLRFITHGPKDNYPWATGVIDALKWFLLDPSA